MSVSAIDENVRRGNARRAFQLRHRWIERLAGHHQNVTSYDGQTSAVHFQDGGHAAKHSLLSASFPGCDSSRDDHRVVSLQFDGRRTHPQAAFRPRSHRRDQYWDAGEHNERKGANATRE
jgi:hypothetical protein